MNTTTRAALAAFALPLLLSLALQGGSCGAGGGGKNSVGPRAANAPARTPGGGNRSDGVGAEQRREGKPVAEGTWGGEGVRLEVGAGGASFEFDCAHGTTGRLFTGASGDFSFSGIFTREGGPVRGDGPEQKTPARYSGRVEGKTMTLRLSVEGMDGAQTFTLTHGGAAELRKCL